MKLFWKKYSKLIFLLVSAISLLLYLFAYHDMQTAEGVGLYFAIRMNQADKVPFDFAADVVRMGGTLLLLLLPCLLQKHRGTDSFWRLLSAWMALMPVVSMAELIPLFDRTRGNLWKISLEESGLWESFWVGDLELARLLLIWLPWMCVMMAGLALAKHKVILRWYKVVWGIAIFLLVMLSVFPGLLAVWQFAVLYLVLLVVFDLWERLLECYPKAQLCGMCLFGLLWFRGIYRLLELMSASHIAG